MGTPYGALKVQIDSSPRISVIADTARTIVAVPDDAAAQAESCSTAPVHGDICANIFYNGGSAPVWNQGTAKNVAPSSYSCTNALCMWVYGCEITIVTKCDRYVNFFVYAPNTSGSVCWNWGAYRYVFTKAQWDGGAVSSNSVWVTWNTGC